MSCWFSEFISNAFGAFIGSGLVGLGLKEWLTHKSNLKLADHQSSLEKGNAHYSKYMAAFDDLARLKADITPEINNSVIDWDDAKREIAMSMSINLRMIKRFRGKHPLLPASIKNLLDEAQSAASEGRLGIDDAMKTGNFDLTNAEKMWTALSTAESELEKQIFQLAQGITK